MRGFLLLFFFASAGPQLFADNDHNPVGVTGAFEGMVTTGSGYNVLSHSARREIDDIVVPGSIGKYPLKMTRYYNTRSDAYGGVMGPGWTHEYLWTASTSPSRFKYPNGNEIDNSCFGSLAVSDYWQTLTCTTSCVGDFRLADGGTVHFDSSNGYFQARTIKDPYGQTTTLAYYSSGPNTGFLSRVTEPGGRNLQFTYSQLSGWTFLTEVDAYDGRGNRIDYVVYHYTSKPTGGSNPATMMCLTSVDYSDGTHANYTYRTDNQPDHPNQPCPCMIKLLPLVSGCDDVRSRGPMRRVAYQYQDQGPHGAILRERYWDGVEGDEGSGPTVSRIDPAAPSPLLQQPTFETNFTEYRGDGATRTFNYTSLHLIRTHGDPEVCPEGFTGPAPQQFPLSYTDFEGNSTTLGYDTNWYVNSVRDSNNHTTTYARGSPPPNGIGEILTITHPCGSHIDYTYDNKGHYVHSVSDERQKVTTYTRNASTHLVTHIDYPSDANTPASSEDFTYNSFGQVLTHHLKNGAWESFVYDSRGLLTDKYNPKVGATAPGGSDPHTHYDYYISENSYSVTINGQPATIYPWADRVKKVTLPANVSNKIATETYEYDRALSGGLTNLNGGARPGRGLVTKVTHSAPESAYKTFKYDQYGNKGWEDNELRNVTQYTYDDYNRLLATTDPLGKTVSYDYAPTQGNATQSQQHTSNSPSWITLHSGIKTHNVYDDNWRKTSTTPADGVLNPTRFAYDNAGNLTDVTDPRGKITYNVYDCRDRKVQTTEAYTTSIAATTVWHYDAASNINRIDRPDGVTETKGYDALNRMIWESVPRQVPGVTPAPTPVPIRTDIYYNPSGTIEHVRDARLKITSFQYNASDEKTQMTYPDGVSTQQWSWDDAHNLASRTTVKAVNPREIQSFSYDNRNRKTGMSWNNNPDYATYGYDAASHLISAANANSTVTRQYDAAGHLTLDQQSVTGLGSAKSVNYPPYDDDGRLTGVNVTGASYNYTYGYDTAGRFWTISPGGGSVLFKYEYDPSSNETHRYAYLPNSTTIDQVYARDSLNRMSSRLVKRKDATFSTEAYTYEHMNRVVEVRGGGSADSFVFYTDGELMSGTYGGGPHFPFTEGQEPDLDTADNIDPNAGYQPPEVEDPEPTPPPEDPTDTPVGTLLPMFLPTGRSIGYYYDKAGNRQQVTDTANPTINYVQNNLNQYNSASGCSISNGPEHEVSSFQGLYDTQLVNYHYLNDEHLASVDVGGSYRYFFYDALGRCVKRSPTFADGGNTTYYIYDGEKPIVEYGSAGGILGRNVYGKGIDEILMRTDPNANGGNPIYYAQDHEGSVTHLLDGRSTPATQTGNVIEQYHYDAFGLPTFYDANTNVISSTAYNNRFLFTGREYAATYRNNIYVPAFRFYEYRARAYHPDLGRFMSEDPKLFDAGDYNLFRYCHNDPIDSADPMGLASEIVGITNPRQESQWKAKEDNSYNFIMGLMQRQFNSAISAGMAGYSAYQAWSALTSAVGNTTTAQGPPGQVTTRTANAPQLNPAFVREGKKDVDDAGDYAEKNNEPTGYNIYQRPDKTVFSLQATKTEYTSNHQYIEHYPDNPPGATLIGNAHWHMQDRHNPYAGSSFSGLDTRAGRYHPVMHNSNNHSWPYAIFYKGWRWGLNSDGVLGSASPYNY